MARIEIALTGAGGQGLLLAGYVLAEAAILDGKVALQASMYGPEARLGSSRSDVVISDEEITYPRATRPDILLVLNQDSCDKFVKTLKENGILICDTTDVKRIPDEDKIKNLYKLPLARMASQEFGTPLVTNILSLGFIAGLTGIVSKKALEESIKKVVKKKFVELNLKAVAKGFELAEQYKTTGVKS